VDGILIRTGAAPEGVRDAVAAHVLQQGWRLRWTGPWMAELERGSIGGDLVLGPLNPFQRVTLEVFVGAGTTDVVLWHAQGRWYGASKSAPRKASRRYAELTDTTVAMLGAQVLETQQLHR
jgi:hypothetical protein